MYIYLLLFAHEGQLNIHSTQINTLYKQISLFFEYISGGGM